jgi:hypothetical protein
MELSEALKKVGFKPLKQTPEIQTFATEKGIMISEEDPFSWIKSGKCLFVYDEKGNPWAILGRNPLPEIKRFLSSRDEQRLDLNSDAIVPEIFKKTQERISFWRHVLEK